MPASYGCDDFIWIGGPREGRWVEIVFVEEAVDGGLEVGDGSEDAAPEPALREFGEEALDGVEPGARCRREVECPARMGGEPLMDFRVLVGGVVIEDGVDDLPGRDLGLDGVEKADELWPAPIEWSGVYVSSLSA